MMRFSFYALASFWAVTKRHDVVATDKASDQTEQSIDLGKYQGSDDETLGTSWRERKLMWVIDQKRVYNNIWADYDKWEIPSDSSDADDEDRIMSTDVCQKYGRYSRRYCMSPPDCRREGRGFPWPLKLCLNRVPKPEDPDEFYVKIMKCIPRFENCDKCMCGRLKRNRQLCVYTGTSPDDDIVDLSCRRDFSVDLDNDAYSPYSNPSYSTDTTKSERRRRKKVQRRKRRRDGLRTRHFF